MFKKLAMLAVIPALVSCGGQKTYRFVGRVFDGVTGAQIKKYKLEAQYSSGRGQGSVDADGRYVSIEIPSGHDFTIYVSGAGATATTYRPFYSVNRALGDFGRANAFGGTNRSTDTYNTGRENEPSAPRSYNLQETMNYDIYLYPTATQAPEMTVQVFQTDSVTRPAAGTLRFSPTVAASNLEFSPEAIAGQTFGNTADLQFGVVNATIANGQVVVPAGALVYGVTYRMDVFGVPGYNTVLNQAVTAGTNRTAEIYIAPAVTAQPLQVVYHTGSKGLRFDNGELTVVFNQTVAFAEDARTKAGQERDLAVAMFPTNITFAPDATAPSPAVRTNVVPTPDNGQANNCGVVADLDGGTSGTVLKVRWNKAQCLSNADGGDLGTPGDGIRLNWNLTSLRVRATSAGGTAGVTTLDGGVQFTDGATSAGLDNASIIDQVGAGGGL